MLCPICKTDLQMSERQGVEIDYCTQCRGVWLDRGELDKIIERSSVSAPMPTAGSDRRRYDNEYDDDRRPYDKRKKRGSFLGELFDF